MVCLLYTNCSFVKWKNNYDSTNYYKFPYFELSKTRIPVSDLQHLTLGHGLDWLILL